MKGFALNEQISGIKNIFTGKAFSFTSTKAGSIAFKIFRTLFIFGLSYLFLFPVIYMFSTAFQSVNSVSDPSVVWIPKELSIEPLKAVIELIGYWDSVILTLVITVPSTILALLSCSLAGYGLARFRFPGEKIIFFAVLITIVVPPQAVLVSSYMNFRFFDFGGIMKLFAPLLGYDSFNMIDTPMTFILPSAFASGLRNGLFVFIFRQYFGGMPKELEEASKIDGCGAFFTYVRIMMPLAKSAFITVALFSFVWHWNDFYSMSFYFTGKIRPITPTLSTLLDQMVVGGFTQSSSVSQINLRVYFAAGALLTVAPPLILYIILQRQFTESIEKSGIVG